MRNILVVRPYYGANISGDMHGDYGVIEYFNQTFPDLSLITGVTILNQQNYNVTFIDANAEKLYPDEIVKRMAGNYHQIIIKAAYATIRLDIEFAKCLKKLFPESKIIMTGRAATFLNKWLRRFVKEVDQVSLIRTEDYLNQLAGEKQKILSLDEFPTLDYSLSPYKQYVSCGGELRATLYTSRGCIHNCDYCPYVALYDGRCEVRSLDKLINDIEAILSLGFKKIQFRDQYFSCNKARTLAICNLIKERKLKFNWVCETRIDKLDKETIDAMIEAGMEMICFGVETASEKMLKNYHRPVPDIKKSKDIIQYINENGSSTLAFYILGFPNESWQDMKDTYDLASELGATHASFNIWTPFMGTKSGIDYTGNDEISIDSFPVLKNYLDNNYANEINTDMTEFVLNFLNNSYVFQMKGLKTLYQDHYQIETTKKLILSGYQRSKAFFRSILGESSLNTDFTIENGEILDEII